MRPLNISLSASEVEVSRARMYASNKAGLWDTMVKEVLYRRRVLNVAGFFRLGTILAGPLREACS